MAQKYQEQLEAQRKAQERAKAVAGIPVIGKGGTTIAKIDEYLRANPDVKYFRIADGGKVNDGRVRAYMPIPGTGQAQGSQNSNNRKPPKYYKFTDGSAAIVATDRDVRSKVFNRYGNYAAVGSASGRRGERPTIGITAKPGSFYSEFGYDYDPRDGLILSRDDFGSVKESFRARDKSGFLNDPGQYAGKSITGQVSPDAAELAEAQREQQGERSSGGKGSPGVPSILGARAEEDSGLSTNEQRKTVLG